MNKRILTRYGSYIVNALWQDGKIVQFDMDEASEGAALGGIYIAKVKNIVRNINAAFVEIGRNRVCYYALDEMLPIFSKSANGKTVCIGDEIVVQVVKEGMKTKDPVVSSQLNLNGRYVVLIRGDSQLAFSKKIRDNAWKEEMRQRIPMERYSGVGILLRTNAQYAGEVEIQTEIEQLYSCYQTILYNSKYRTVYSRLYTPECQYLKTVRDTYSQNLEEIITDDGEVFQRLKEYFERNFPEESEKLRFYEDDLLPLEKLYSIRYTIEKALEKRVWLKSGAYLIIEPTEALVSIDVNTGKAVAGKRAEEETFFKINKEAAVEIARQLRLRNLSGIILVDFINMKKKENQKKLMEWMRHLTADDPVKTVVVDITKLNLIEITRKKEKKPLYELWADRQ